MDSLSKRKSSWVVCAGLALVFSQSCSKENNIESTDVTVGDVCGPKVACADGSCAFGFCRNPCRDDSDCANSGVCLSDGQTKGCRLAAEAKCAASDPCPAGLACADDGSCRTPCDDERACDVEGQECVDGACVEASTGIDTGGTGNGTAGTSAGTAGSGGKAATSSGGMSGSSGSGSVDGGEPSTAGQGGAAPACGELGQDCCVGASACNAANGLTCGQGSQCECDLGATDCDGEAANGCEANLVGDADNCGKCEHDCGGGQCVASKCEAVLVVPASTTELWSQTWDPGSSGAFDYVNRDAAGWVGPAKEPVGGKVQLRAYAPDGTPGAFLTNEPNDIPIQLGPFISPIGIVWTESGTLRRMSRGGSAIVTVLTNSITALRMDATSLYVLSPYAGSNGALNKFAQGSLTPSPLYTVSDKDAYSDVALDGSGGLYLQCSGDFIGGCTLGALYGGSTAGASLAVRYTLFAGAENTSRLVATPETVFGYGGAVTKLSLAGPTRSVILPASAGLGAISHAVTDGAWVYFIASGSGLYRMSTAGGTPQKLHSGVALWGLSQDQDNLYFWQAGYNRIRKPAD